MNIRVPEELVSLAKIFKKNNEKLYIVGGYIRNQILGVPDNFNIDIDVCSKTLPEKVEKMLENSEFSTKYMNKDLGVIEIKGKIRVEHATFRKEKYNFSGKHIPNNVEFITDINEDAKRRDFRCNAIYYDILEEEIVDPLNGVLDTQKKVIQTTLDPEIVFKDDAERILRMVRFASTLNFKIEERTYNEAKKNVSKLNLISSTRKREEFSEIVLADTKYSFLTDIKYAHVRGVMILADLGALRYVLPALDEIRTSELTDKRGRLLFDHVMNVFAYSRPEVRLSALLHDVGKVKAKKEFNNFNGAKEFEPIIIEKNLGEEGLNFSKKIIERVKNVVFMQDFNKLGLESAKNIRKFIFENKDNVELIVYLKDAIELDKTNRKRNSYSGRKILKIYNKMKENKTPFSLAELNLKGDKLIEEFPELKLNKIGLILNKLLIKCVHKPFLNNENILLNISKKIINRKKKEYLE